ncbi:Granule-bound starch synthase 1 [Durusdinium trenchii]|uniref:Chloroplastic/amyloplastic (Granule-bound starch synthase I) (GBSS-I) n=1 Tax=Durusdinium trenchii TaxID=1381693 RepID=A0ABP0N0X6_9DINO
MDGLPIALAALGHRVMVVSPRYDQYAEGWDTSYWSSVPMGGKQESVHFFHAHKQKVDYVFVDHPTFLERVDGMTGAKLYGPEWGKDGLLYGGNCVVVANDWHSALVPMLIHAEKSVQPGKLPFDRMSQLRLASILGVPDRYLDSITFKMPLRIGKYNEKVSCINTMSAGLRYSDRATKLA